MNLFNKINEPLASRLRPSAFDEVYGQSELIGQLRKFNYPVSIILYGPPGTGKTTIASILGKSWGLPFRSLSGVSSGVKEIREITDEAEKKGTMLLFLDEIHRFSTSQQDSLLHSVEDGRIVLIGATTENPAFRINRPLLSRCHVFRLDFLDRAALAEILRKSVNETGLSLADDAKNEIMEMAAGDGRRLIGIMEGLHSFVSKDSTVDAGVVKNFMSQRVIQYDKNREYHYDVISAFIKSVRGSDPDAALYYLAIMLEGGEDPLFIMRRLVILASEDVGNASVHGLNLAVSGMTAVEKIGMPEARIIIAQVTTFLASCPKSNSSYKALDDALAYVRKQNEVRIPDHLRNPVTHLHAKEGAGKGYIYPHDRPGNFTETNYFPESMRGKEPRFYVPTENGMEKKIKEYLGSLWRKRKYD